MTEKEFNGLVIGDAVAIGNGKKAHRLAAIKHEDGIAWVCDWAYASTDLRIADVKTPRCKICWGEDD